MRGVGHAGAAGLLLNKRHFGRRMRRCCGLASASGCARGGPLRGHEILPEWRSGSGRSGSHLGCRSTLGQGSSGCLYVFGRRIEAKLLAVPYELCDLGQQIHFSSCVEGGEPGSFPGAHNIPRCA